VYINLILRYQNIGGCVRGVFLWPMSDLSENVV